MRKLFAYIGRRPRFLLMTAVTGLLSGALCAALGIVLPYSLLVVTPASLAICELHTYLFGDKEP